MEYWKKPGEVLIDGGKIFAGDAYIDTAMIINGAIKTLSVGGQEITFPRGIRETNFEYFSGTAVEDPTFNTTDYYMGYLEVCELAVGATGAPLIITASVFVAGSDNVGDSEPWKTSMALFRGTTKLTAYLEFCKLETHPAGFLTQREIEGVFTTQLYLPTGISGTYKMKLATYGKNVAVGDRSLTILEAKR